MCGAQRGQFLGTGCAGLRRTRHEVTGEDNYVRLQAVGDLDSATHLIPLDVPPQVEITQLDD
jgi:hypothetical protein